MELGSILLGVAAALGLAAFVIDPLIKTPGRAGAPGNQPERDHDALEALRHLEFDYQTGKINPEDYALLRPILLVQAAEQRQNRPGDSRVCPTCQQSCLPDDHYCTTCGRELMGETRTMNQKA